MGNLHLNVLPFVNDRLETTAIDNRFGQGKTVQYDMNIPGIGGVINLTGHVERVVVLAPVGHDHVDNQFVYGIP